MAKYQGNTIRIKYHFFYKNSLRIRHIDLPCSLADTVQYIKEQIQGSLGVPWDQQKLYTKRDKKKKKLEDNNKTLADYNIQDGTTLELKTFMRFSYNGKFYTDNQEIDTIPSYARARYIKRLSKVPIKNQLAFRTLLPPDETSDSRPCSSYKPLLGVVHVLSVDYEDKTQILSLDDLGLAKEYTGDAGYDEPMDMGLTSTQGRVSKTFRFEFYYKKRAYNISLSSDKTIKALKQKVAEQTEVPIARQRFIKTWMNYVFETHLIDANNTKFTAQDIFD